MSDCLGAWLTVATTAAVLLVSVCLNLIFCSQMQRNKTHRESGKQNYSMTYHRERSNHSEDGGQPGFHDPDRVVQENPIYGNIHSGRDVAVLYEKMTKGHIKNNKKPPESDLNYASLDLGGTKNKKRNRHQRNPSQDQRKVQAHLSEPAAASLAEFLEVASEEEAQLPSRNSSHVVSHSNIYLNSQQIALETEERGREAGEGCANVNTATRFINDSMDRLIDGFDHDDSQRD